jgi:hypothetical protein
VPDRRGWSALDQALEPGGAGCRLRRGLLVAGAGVDGSVARCGVFGQFEEGFQVVCGLHGAQAGGQGEGGEGGDGPGVGS